jgi:hypothetical protein
MKFYKISLIFFFGIILIFLCSLIYCYFNYQFWAHVNTTRFKHLIEYKGKRIKAYRGRQILIHKEFKPYLDRVDNYAGENNLDLIITHSYRQKDQKLNNNIVKPAGFSNHIAGFAIDFNISYKGKYFNSNSLKKSKLSKLPPDIQNFIKDLRNDKYLRWGGDFSVEDQVHIDYPLNIIHFNNWKLYSAHCHLDFSKSKYFWKIW